MAAHAHAAAEAAGLKAQATGLLLSKLHIPNSAKGTDGAQDSPRSDCATPGLRPPALLHLHACSQAGSSSDGGSMMGKAYSMDGSVCSVSTPVAGQQQQQHYHCSPLQQQHSGGHHHTPQQQPPHPPASPTAAAYSVAKKTFGKLFGGSSGCSNGGSAPPSPTGLIAAFRAIIPKGGSGAASRHSQQQQQQQQQEQQRRAYATPLLVQPARRSALLAVCPHLPPSMQRAEWALDDFIILNKLYTGYASVVYQAQCKRSKEVVVLKSYTLGSICELYQHQIFREVRLHNSLQHENIVKLYAAFKEGDRVVMVQEYADGGDLFSMLHKYGGRLGEKVAVQMVLEPFLRVLQYLHTRSIVHRDIKPENILFTKGSSCLKLADFGLAIDLREERAVTRAGTLDYMAPEVLQCPYKSRPEENKEKEHLHYGNSVDSWAVGVLTYELLVGCPPFYDQSRSNTEARIKGGVPTFPAAMSEAARSFICEALCKDPQRRPSCLDLLHHPWIEMFRARRSMRCINAAGEDEAAAAPASASPSGGPAAGVGAIPPKAAAALAAAEAGPCVVHSASSPCLGSGAAQAALLGHVKAAAAAPIPGAAQPAITALGQLSRLAAPAGLGR